MKVTISAPGWFQPAYLWATFLDEESQLERIITPLPFSRVKEFGTPEGRTCSLVPLGAWSYAVRRFGSRAPRRLLARNQLATTAAFDAIAARLLGRCQVFNGWSGSALTSLRRAHRSGIPTVLQVGSAHIVVQTELIRNEQVKFSAPGPITHPRVIARALEEYAEADRIVVPSAFVRRTFREQGVPDAKLITVPWAALPVARGGGAKPVEGPAAGITILFIGSCTLQKGIPYLLTAARQLGPEVAVRLVGPPNPALVKLLGGLPSNVTAVGIKRGSELEEELRSADIFVLPSVQDGSALVTIEAMLAGLPVVVSDRAGAALVEDGVSGYVVPAGDADALAERLAMLARDAQVRRRIGAAARAAAEPRTPRVYGEELRRMVYAPLLATR